MRLVLALVVGLAGPAAATQEYVLPTLFDVVDVASDDVLNVRRRPSARSEIVGTLAPDATGVEVVAHDASGRWGRVVADEGTGWVAMRYLAYRTDVWNEGELPQTLRCLGTEPFWSLVPQGGTLVWSTPEEERRFEIEAVLTTGTFRSPRRAVAAAADTERVVLAVVPAECSDGMSDRVYGLDATVVFTGGASPRMHAGCCTLSR